MSTTSPTRPDSAHPTRPAPPAHLDWLRAEAADWARQGLVSEAQAQTIMSRYHAARRVSLARLLLTLGAVFVGVGLIWLVASNLDALPPLVRFLAVAALWVSATVGAELLALRRAHGGPIPSPVVHAARLLAVLLFGAVVFQAAQSLQVPAYEPKLVGLWSLGALAHGYTIRSAVPVTVGIITGFTWLVWDAAWSEPSALGILLAVSALGVGAVSVAALHDSVRPRDPMSPPWRQAGALAVLGVLFAAALPYLDLGGFAWTRTLVVECVVAVVLALAALVVALRAGSPRLLWAEPVGAIATSTLAVALLAWEAGADADEVGLLDWAHAAVAVGAYLLVAVGVAVIGILRDAKGLTGLALVSLVLFTTFQSFAVFAQIIEGAWLFLVVGVILAGTGYLADRARRHLAESLEEGVVR